MIRWHTHVITDHSCFTAWLNKKNEFPTCLCHQMLYKEKTDLLLITCSPIWFFTSGEGKQIKHMHTYHKCIECDPYYLHSFSHVIHKQHLLHYLLGFFFINLEDSSDSFSRPLFNYCWFSVMWPAQYLFQKTCNEFLAISFFIIYKKKLRKKNLHVSAMP